MSMWQELVQDRNNQMTTRKVVDFGIIASRRTRSRTPARTPSSPRRTRTPAQVQEQTSKEDGAGTKTKTRRRSEMLSEQEQTLVKTTIQNQKVKTESTKKKKTNQARRKEVSSPFKKKSTPVRRRGLTDKTRMLSGKLVPHRPDIRSLIFNWEERTKIVPVLTPAVIGGPNLEPKP